MKAYLMFPLIALLVSGCSQAPAASAAAPAVVYQVAEVGLQYTLPSGWKKEADGQLANAEDDLVVQFVQPDEPVDSAGLKELASKLSGKFSDLKIDGEPSQRQSHDLHILAIHGSGTTKNISTEWEIVCIQGGPRPLLLFEIANGQGTLNKNRDKLDQLASSFQPTPGAPVASETPEESASSE